jgi:hypothetical protein
MEGARLPVERFRRHRPASLDQARQNRISRAGQARSSLRREGRACGRIPQYGCPYPIV